jgi:hypothetical protein
MPKQTASLVVQIAIAVKMSSNPMSSLLVRFEPHKEDTPILYSLQSPSTVE